MPSPATGKVLNHEKMKEAYKSKEVMEITYIHALFEKVENKGMKNKGSVNLHNKNKQCDRCEY